MEVMHTIIVFAAFMSCIIVPLMFSIKQKEYTEDDRTEARSNSGTHFMKG